MMANLNGYNADEYDPLDGFEVLPAGEYLAMATDSQMRSTKAGTGSYLEIVWEVIDGDHRGRKLWSRLNLDNPHANAVELANRELSSICRAVGVMRPRDSAELHGKPVKLKVGVEKRQDNGEPANRIKGYAPVDGVPALKPNTGGPSKPPWQR
jgi:hypothetical protein